MRGAQSPYYGILHTTNKVSDRPQIHKSLIFFPFFFHYWKIFHIFATANSRRATSQEARAAIGREHYILECVADALFLAVGT